MILIDIGNTRIKWAQQYAGKLEKMHAIVHLNNPIESLILTAWQNLSRPDCIYLACVGPQSIKQQVIQVAKHIWPDVRVQEIYTQKCAHGVHNAYPKHTKLGVDRWLSMLAANQHYKVPICIVSCGSAITLDIVDKEGQHLGGMIMPGLNLMQQALSNGTANLKFTSEQYPQGLANDTEAAIYNGNFNAIKGFVEQGLAEYKQPLQCN
jgi:type III pantothenate kinase